MYEVNATPLDNDKDITQMIPQSVLLCIYAKENICMATEVFVIQHSDKTIQ